MNYCSVTALLLLLLGSLSASHHHRRHHEERSDEDRSDENRYDDHHNNKKQERKPSNGLLSSALGLAVGNAARLVNPVITGARVVQPAVSTVVEGAKEVAVIATDPRPIFPDWGLRNDAKVMNLVHRKIVVINGLMLRNSRITFDLFARDLY
ncbi:hypothetical protein B566_EDAN009777 [Ephemera danica]|nr:hypothetical protein B566_EDAN009777 [Ephemera danica]